MGNLSWQSAGIILLEMHKLTRYEHAPVLKFGPGFDAAQDASQLATWVEEFCRDKGRPPKRLSFTFHASNTDANDACHFMKLCVNNPAISAVLSQAKVELVFAGSMSDVITASTHARILNQTF